MQSLDKKLYSFRVDASALGGYLEQPFEKNIRTVAPVSLPPVGGFAMARSEAFTLNEIVRCSSAYTRVSGRELDGSISILVTAVVEDLNLLEVVTARRVVSQLSISIPEGGPRQISLVGSRFEGLRVAGTEDFPDIQRIGCEYVGGLTQSTEGGDDANAGEPGAKSGAWVKGRGWRSMIEGCEAHTVLIPGFGRITLGQLLVTPDSVQLVAIRADLGCPVKGGVTISAGGGGGTHDT
jgi:hypothetical protein